MIQEGTRHYYLEPKPIHRTNCTSYHILLLTISVCWPLEQLERRRLASLNNIGSSWRQIGESWRQIGASWRFGELCESSRSVWEKNRGAARREKEEETRNKQDERRKKQHERSKKKEGRSNTKGEQTTKQTLCIKTPDQPMLAAPYYRYMYCIL